MNHLVRQTIRQSMREQVIKPTALRRDNTIHVDDIADHITDPPLTRGGGILIHPSSLIFCGISVLYTASVLGIIPQNLTNRFYNFLFNQRDIVVNKAGHLVELAIGLAILFLLHTIITPWIQSRVNTY